MQSLLEVFGERFIKPSLSITLQTPQNDPNARLLEFTDYTE